MSEALTAIDASTQVQITRRADYQPPHYLIDEVHLKFDLYETHTLVTSRLHVRRNRHLAAVDTGLFLNGEALELVSVSVNGSELAANAFQKTEQGLVIPAMPEVAEVEIITNIFPDQNTALSGLYRSCGTYCTQCEAEGFRRITYYPDRPDVLAKFTTEITADQTKYPVLLSNGNLIAKEALEEGRHLARWEDPFNKPCYLFALVAGDFDLLKDQFITQSGRTIQLQIFVEKGYGSEAQHAMYSLKEAMRWDEVTYGREYDLDTYMIVAISDFNMGAMENKGLNIFNTKYVLARPETATDDDYIHILSVIGHEYFHNWSGNRVTCRDWFQLSLKEGLTIFRDQSFTEDLISKAVMRIRDVQYLREYQFPEDNGPLAHSVRPDSYMEINNFYTATVYNKGAEVLRMLQTILGRDVFRKAMDLYFARYDGQAVTIDDYVQVMEDVSGLNLSQFKRWYSQAGTPILTVKEDYDPVQQIYHLQLSQSCPQTPDQSTKEPFLIPVKMGLLNQAGQPIPLHYQGSDSQSAHKDELVLLLKEPSQSFRFTQVTEKPVLSVLRSFSAPVKLNYEQTRSQLAILSEHDRDAFNRYEAGQTLALQTMLLLINDYQANQPLIVPADLLECYSKLLADESVDEFLLSDMLSLPTEHYIGEQMPVVQVDAIHAVRKHLIVAIANHLEKQLLNRYQRYQSVATTGQFDVRSIGQRQLKNRCLTYLLATDKHIQLGLNQFHQALTLRMADTLPVFKALTNLDFSQRLEIISTFYDAWKKDALVIDKWLAVQAACQLPGALQQVKALMRHPAFDIQNPNKVYALIGTYAHQNPVSFHAVSGEGYAFLGSAVAQLDKLNPQVAARMVKPLTAWKRYDKERQILMKNQLKSLLDVSSLSRDVYELVTKSLD